MVIRSLTFCRFTIPERNSDLSGNHSIDTYNLKVIPLKKLRKHIEQNSVLISVV